LPLIIESAAPLDTALAAARGQGFFVPAGNFVPEKNSHVRA